MRRFSEGLCLDDQAVSQASSWVRAMQAPISGNKWRCLQPSNRHRALAYIHEADAGMKNSLSETATSSKVTDSLAYPGSRASRT